MPKIYEPIRQDIIIGKSYTCEKLYDNRNLLRLKLVSICGDVLFVNFKEHISYRICDEGDCFKLLFDIPKSIGLGRLFYEIKNSDYLNWLKEQNYDSWDYSGVRHYGIYASNYMIDVLSHDEINVFRPTNICTVHLPK